MAANSAEPGSWTFLYDENTLPEVLIDVDRYKETNNSYGSLKSAVPESGRINQPQSITEGSITTGTIDSGKFTFDYTTGGVIRSNNDYTILMFDDTFIWLSEDEGFIMVEEFTKDDIINMISTEGKFTAGKIDNGTIQEAV